MKKKVSICIPVFGSEPYLEKCLKSVKDQSFGDYEIIVVNDGSSGVDAQGNCCKKVVKNCKKKYRLNINYIEHDENKGLLEARRTAVYAARGEYILNLDSDDFLPSDALEILFKKAEEFDADIVHGAGELFVSDFDEKLVDIDDNVLQKIREDKKRKIKMVFPGVMEEKKIFNGYLVENNHCGFLWGKLFKRELYLEAFDKIPPMFCTMAEDFIQYFWISFFARKYVGVESCVYYYCDNTGVSSSRIIDSLERWEQVCSVASVFTGIYTSLEEREIKLDDVQMKRLSGACRYYVKNNIMQMREAVVPELRDEARLILCDYWGEGLVTKVEKNC